MFINMDFISFAIEDVVDLAVSGYYNMHIWLLLKDKIIVYQPIKFEAKLEIDMLVTTYSSIKNKKNIFKGEYDLFLE